MDFILICLLVIVAITSRVCATAGDSQPRQPLLLTLLKNESTHDSDGTSAAGIPPPSVNINMTFPLPQGMHVPISIRINVNRLKVEHPSSVVGLIASFTIPPGAYVDPFELEKRHDWKFSTQVDYFVSSSSCSSMPHATKASSENDNNEQHVDDQPPNNACTLEEGILTGSETPKIYKYWPFGYIASSSASTTPLHLRVHTYSTTVDPESMAEHSNSTMVALEFPDILIPLRDESQGLMRESCIQSFNISFILPLHLRYHLPAHGNADYANNANNTNNETSELKDVIKRFAKVHIPSPKVWVGAKRVTMIEVEGGGDGGSVGGRGGATGERHDDILGMSNQVVCTGLASSEMNLYRYTRRYIAQRTTVERIYDVTHLGNKGNALNEITIKNIEGFNYTLCQQTNTQNVPDSESTLTLSMPIGNADDLPFVAFVNTCVVAVTFIVVVLFTVYYGLKSN